MLLSPVSCPQTMQVELWAEPAWDGAQWTRSEQMMLQEQGGVLHLLSFWHCWGWDWQNSGATKSFLLRLGLLVMAAVRREGATWLSGFPTIRKVQGLGDSGFWAASWRSTTAPSSAHSGCVHGALQSPGCALQCLFPDPITYSTLVFSCLGLIILNPSIWLSAAQPGQIWGSLGDPRQRYRRIICLSFMLLRALVSWEGRGKSYRDFPNGGKAAPHAAPVPQPHKSQTLLQDRVSCCRGCVGKRVLAGAQHLRRGAPPPGHTLTHASTAGCFWKQSSPGTHWHSRVQQIGTQTRHPCATFPELPCSCFLVFYCCPRAVFLLPPAGWRSLQLA